MNRSVVRCLRVRNLIPFLKKAPGPEDGKSLSKEEQERLKGFMSKIRKDKAMSLVVHTETLSLEEATDIEDKIDMDSIRARGFMKYRYNYDPPVNLEENVKCVLSKICPKLVGSNDDVMKIDLRRDLQLKFQLLDALGGLLKHVIPNPELHRVETVGDVIEFYKQPVSNLTVYAQMARDKSENVPQNLHIIEHPFRFHPEDKDAYHGGITAFPGRGGEVYGLRNKRLYRQFQPKEHWFDYEDQSFDYTRVDKDMPWDPVIAQYMDRYPYKRYNLKTKKFARVRPEKNAVVS